MNNEISEQQVAMLPAILKGKDVKGTMENWMIAEEFGYKLCYGHFNGRSWRTSYLIEVNEEQGFIETKNSIYLLGNKLKLKEDEFYLLGNKLKLKEDE